ncbi:tRNA glutamyl-Q(34) synthetase GluQRS [Psychrobacter sp. I-STPA6b]|uniref:tRNA glutamyl-Q(34) synthetase GluQRS n=1 Tax=Psychrobacter sp. I-STPA6b TaxID=2585718 RepID=UPI001D0CDCD6|nr:tRNA glutamyl-Q(34) synthetase GluQRS [Psychrobacter sp. I-STPA6b]
MRKPLPHSPIGRFAPSPTGALHLGSLTTAVASYCHIKSIQGQWLVRIEDTDTVRCERKFSQQILLDLEHLGLHWDGEVLYQSTRTNIYNEWLQDKLLPRLYGCSCSRKQISAYHQKTSTHATHSNQTSNTTSAHSLYPRLCLDKHKALDNNKVRVQLPSYHIGFLDQIQGMQWSNPQLSLGDVVLRRANGIINYFLAVSVDDGLQGVTHIMRGLDILPLTCAQIVLMDYMNLPAIQAWQHLPLVENRTGQKLSKQNLATPIDTSTPEKACQQLAKALQLLHQCPVELTTPEQMLAQAVAQWDIQPLQYQHCLAQVD